MDALSERVLFAGYGRGLLDRFDTSVDEVRVRAAGRSTRPDWLALRLLAVSRMDRSPVGPRPGGPRRRSAAAG